MKKISLLAVILLSMAFNSFSSHYVGGEIYWRCIAGTGKYIFYLDFYRDCGPTSAGIGTGPTSLQVLNTPRPNNNTLSSIPMSWVPPEPGAPLGPNGGRSVAPTCIGCGSSAATNSISCTNQDNGTLEKYSYRSAAITLAGKPPSGLANQWLNGWVFSWTAPCCRSSDVINISNTSTGALFKAIMYGDGRPSQDPCYDNSPEFKEQPASIVCQKYDFQFNHNATDLELDSLDFKWANIVDRSTSTTQYAPQFNSWASGYSLANPTPTAAANALNRPARIDNKSGAINMFVVLPANVPANDSRIFITSAQVDAWGCDQNGNTVKKATIFRDMPFNIFDCPRNTFTYNDNNGNPIQVDEQNQPPYIQIDSTSGSLNLDTTIYAGDSISVSFLAIDTNVSRCSPTLLTNVTIEPSGFQFDKNFNDPRGNCPIQPCATLNPAPSGAPVKKLVGLNTVGTKFNWQTTCDHLDISSIVGASCQQLSEGVFKFIMKTYDDFCPVPGINYASITITLKSPDPIGPPIIRCVSANENGTYTITWSEPFYPDTTNSFFSYDLYLGQRGINSTSPFTFLAAPIRQNIKDYEGSFTTVAYAPGQEYAFKMKTNFGCGGLNESAFSNLVSTSNRLTATHIGTLPVGNSLAPFTRVRLDWKTLFEVTTNNTNSTNPTLSASSMLDTWDGKYLIYQRHTPHDSGPWVLLDSITNPNTKTWSTNSPVCNDSVAFKIVTRDTLMNCESHSEAIVMYMVTLDLPPSPPIVEASTLPNGDVFLKWSTAGTTARSYQVYESNAAGARGAFVDSTVAPGDTMLITGAGANLVQKYYSIIPLDFCTGQLGDSSLVSPLFLQGVIVTNTTNCTNEAQLSWSNFEGYVEQGHTIYSSANGSAPSVVGTTPPATRSFNYPVASNTNYQFYVEARRNAQGFVSTSNVKLDTTAELPQKYKVYPPNVRCVRANTGVIELEWIPSENPSNNFISYLIERQDANGVWQILERDSSITSDIFVDANPLGNPVYRVSTSSLYCGNAEDSTASQIVSPMRLSVTPTPLNGPSVRLDWTNISSVNYTNPFEIFKDTSIGFNSQSIIAQGTNTLTDFGVCGEYADYYVQVQDTSGCFSTSNVDGDFFTDPFGPERQLIDYVTVDYTDINNLGVEVVWSPNPSPDVKFYEVQRVFQNVTPRLLATFSQLPGFSYIDTSLALNLDDYREIYLLTANDSCGSPSEGPIDSVYTIDVDATFSICDSANIVTWSRYEYFHSANDVLYEVFASQTKVFNDFISVGFSSDTVFNHVGVDTGSWFYYVKAIENGGSGPFFSRSNLVELYVEYPPAPDFQYMHSVTVMSPFQVDLLCYVDTNSLTRGYQVLKGEQAFNMSNVKYISRDEVIDSKVTYTDYLAETDERSYFYQIRALDSCGNLSINSNLGKSIFLEIITDNVALSNVLYWDKYEEWNNGVAYYLIYKGIDSQFGVNPHDTVFVTSRTGPRLKYVDDVSDYLSANGSLSEGQFCYYVVAVEDGVEVPTLTNITPGEGLSNAVCAFMEPTMYIPNAFSPGSAVNSVFRPEGIYFDFTRYEMVIFNRWGERVFETTDYNRGWNGEVNGGDIAPIGTYVYTIRFIDSKGEERLKKGTVTIIR